jgi:hypothetical protein
MLHQLLLARTMAKTDKIFWREFKDDLKISAEWAATPDIPTFMSLLINFARAQLSVLAKADETTPSRPNPMPFLTNYY